MYIKDASFELVEKLSALPSIADVREEAILSLPVIRHGNDATSMPLALNATTEAATERAGLLANEWGLGVVEVPSVWETGNTGQGVVVGVIDTGVRATHNAFRGSIRSDYNWYDAVNKKTAPYDDDGHGTHVTGTIVGKNGIGVAPGATWIACKSCTNSQGIGCPLAALLGCMQFMLCPTDVNGKNRDCSKAPHMVNNSQGVVAIQRGRLLSTHGAQLGSSRSSQSAIAARDVTLLCSLAHTRM